MFCRSQQTSLQRRRAASLWRTGLAIGLVVAFAMGPALDAPAARADAAQSPNSAIAEPSPAEAIDDVSAGVEPDDTTAASSTDEAEASAGTSDPPTSEVAPAAPGEVEKQHASGPAASFPAAEFAERDRIAAPRSYWPGKSPDEVEIHKKFEWQFTVYDLTLTGGAYAEIGVGRLPQGLKVQMVNSGYSPAMGWWRTIRIDGAAQEEGRFNFQVYASGDSSPQYTMAVWGPDFYKMTSPSKAKGTVGVPFDFTVKATWLNRPLGPADEYPDVEKYAFVGLPPGLRADSGTPGRIVGLPEKSGSFKVTVQFDGQPKWPATLTIDVDKQKMLNSLQYKGIGDEDVLWANLDTANGRTIRFHSDFAGAAHPNFADEYVALEHRDAKDQRLNRVALRGTESGFDLLNTPPWPYENGQILVATHREAGARLIANVDGIPLPRQPETTQRFVIVNDRLVRDVAAITSGEPAEATVGVPYTHQLTASGTGVSWWMLTDGGGGPPGEVEGTLQSGLELDSALPSGLELDGWSGLISGTPTRAGETFITVLVGNSAGTATKSYKMTVKPGEPAPEIISGAPPSGTVSKQYSHQLRSNPAAGASWSVRSGALPLGLELNPDTGLVSGVPTKAGASLLTIVVTTKGGQAAKSYRIEISPGALVNERYPNALQFQAADDHDVLWVGVDAARKQLVGVVESYQLANPGEFAGREYIAVELHDGSGRLLERASVNGDESAVALEQSLRWDYQNGWTVVARHQQAGELITPYSEGKAEPRVAAGSQRFRIIDDRLVREGVATISTPVEGARIVSQPTVRGLAVAHKTVQLAASVGGAVTVLGTTTANGDNTWSFSVPAAKSLPVGTVTLIAVMTDHPASTTAKVTVTVVEVPVATLTMNATAHLVDRLPGRPPGRRLSAP